MLGTFPKTTGYAEIIRDQNISDIILLNVVIQKLDLYLYLYYSFRIITIDYELVTRALPGFKYSRTEGTRAFKSCKCPRSVYGFSAYHTLILNLHVCFDNFPVVTLWNLD